MYKPRHVEVHFLILRRHAGKHFPLVVINEFEYLLNLNSNAIPVAYQLENALPLFDNGCFDRAFWA